MNKGQDRESSRRSFVKKGLVGMCACGCAGMGLAGAAAGVSGAVQEEDPPGMPRKWVAALLPILAEGDPREARRILKGCSASHFEDLKMDATVSRFDGDLPAFLDFLRAEWGWIIEQDAAAGLILVNENKDDCVCPLVQKERGDDLGALCYCSEGFAERLFGAVVGSPVRAEVTESILRGGQRCRYKIQLKA